MIIEEQKQYQDPIEFAVKLVNIFAAIYIDRDYWLSKREAEFFAATWVLIQLGNDNPLNQNGTQIYEKYFKKGSIPASEIHIYIRKLVKKKWIDWDGEAQKIELNPVFLEFQYKFEVGVELGSAATSFIQRLRSANAKHG